jgi:hypothetical protein
MTPLDQIQRWMLAAITHPAGVLAAASADAIDERILPNSRQSATERLAVYSHAYFARLLDVLRDLFPCLRFAVGDELFDQFAVGYLQAHPPVSYTLHHLADRFADFLATSRPVDAGDWSGFLVDLARLEHAIDQVFDGPGPEGHSFNGEPQATAYGSASTQPAGAFGFALNEAAAPGDQHLPLVPGFRLLAFQFPASSYFSAWKAGQNPLWPVAGEEFVALLRRDYIVRRHELLREQFDLLTQLVAGRTLEESLASVADRVTPEQIQHWFTRWSAAGFFVM